MSSHNLKPTVMLSVGDGGGGHCLVRMEWRPAGWSVCLPLLISPCTINSRSSLLAPAHPGGPGKRTVKRLWCGGVVVMLSVHLRPARYWWRHRRRAPAYHLMLMYCQLTSISTQPRARPAIVFCRDVSFDAATLH